MYPPPPPWEPAVKLGGAGTPRQEVQQQPASSSGGFFGFLGRGGGMKPAATIRKRDDYGNLSSMDESVASIKLPHARISKVRLS